MTKSVCFSLNQETAEQPSTSASPALRSHHRGRGRRQSLSPVRCPAPPDQLEQGWKTENDPDVAPIPQFCPDWNLECNWTPPQSKAPSAFSSSFFRADSRTLCAKANKLAERNIAAGKRYKWTTINPAEMFKFIGVLKLPAVRDYWKRKNIFYNQTSNIETSIFQVFQMQSTVPSRGGFVYFVN